MDFMYWSLCHRKLPIDPMALDAGASALRVLKSLHTSKEKTSRNQWLFYYSRVNLMFIPNGLGEGKWTERGFLWWVWCSGFTALQAMTLPASVNKDRAQDLDTKCWSLSTRGPTMAETGRIIVETGSLANCWLLTESYSIACCLSGQ